MISTTKQKTTIPGVYTSCLSATLPLKIFSDLVIPYNALSIGAGQIAGGVVTGPLMKILRMRSQHIIYLAFVGHLTSFILAYLCLPYDSTVHSTDASTYLAPTLNLTLIISFLLGVSDAFWQTQIYVTIGQVFKEDPVNAFAIFKFFQVLQPHYFVLSHILIFSVNGGMCLILLQLLLVPSFTAIDSHNWMCCFDIFLPESQTGNPSSDCGASSRQGNLITNVLVNIIFFKLKLNGVFWKAEINGVFIYHAGF